MTFKFRKVKGSSKYKAWKEWEEGDYVIGDYEDKGTDQFGNPSYRLKIIETTLEGVEEGDTFTLNSNGSLNYKIEDVEIGSVIRVEYCGEDILDNPKSPFNGKTFHKVELEVADGAPISAQAIKKVQDEEEEDFEL